MLVSGAPSPPAKGRRVRRSPAVPCETGALFRSFQKKRAFIREGSKNARIMLAFLVYFAVKSQNTFGNTHPSRIPARFWKLEYQKTFVFLQNAKQNTTSAALSHSRPFWQSGSLTKCDNLAFPLVFAHYTVYRLQLSQISQKIQALEQSGSCN